MLSLKLLLPVSLRYSFTISVATFCNGKLQEIKEIGHRIHSIGFDETWTYYDGMFVSVHCYSSHPLFPISCSVVCPPLLVAEIGFTCSFKNISSERFEKKETKQSYECLY